MLRKSILSRSLLKPPECDHQPRQLSPYTPLSGDVTYSPISSAPSTQQQLFLVRTREEETRRLLRV